jgi:2-isopropylmalate synthase
LEEVAAGEGPIYASFKAIEKIIGKELELNDFSLNSITEGEDALGDAVVKLKENDRIYVGRGLSTDIIEASIKAYINALNKIAYASQENHDNISKEAV